MGILSNSQQINHLFADDWESAKSFYTCKNGICNRCMMKFDEKESLILPLAKLYNQDCTVDAVKLLRSVSSWGKPVFFYHQGKSIKGKVLIKFTGTENFRPSFETLTPFFNEVKTPANIISPYPLTKANRLKEHHLVKLSKQYFEPLGFIKLNLHTVNDFHEFACDDNIGLLMLPLKDLPDYIQFASTLPKYSKLLPTIFQP